MTTITDALASEHALFCEMFEEIVRLLPDLRTVPEVRVISRLVEGVLLRHASVEQNLAFAALDHALAEKGQLARLYQDHEEIDQRLHQATLARKFPEAVRLLKAGLAASRRHFRREEKTVFPLFQKLFKPAELEVLGSKLSLGALALGPHGFSNALRGRLRRSSAVRRSPKSV
jgi:hypothetical protein